MSQTEQVSLKYNKDIFNNISKKEMLMTNNKLTPMDEFVIKVIGSHGKIKGTTKIQKYAFLAEQNQIFTSNNLKPEFIAHHYGPYSQKLTNSIIHLLKLNIIKTCELDDNGPKSITSYELTTPKGQYKFQKLAQTSSEQIEKFKEMTSRFQKNHLYNLLNFVYVNYPEFTTKSTIKKEVLEYEH